MLFSANDFLGFSVIARDGDVGAVRDLLVDADHWTLRYFVVEAGGWLVGRRVLVSPIAIDSVDLGADTITVRLSREQIENSPDNGELPVSRRREIALFNHFGWPYYWPGPYAWGASLYPSIPAMVPAPVEDAAYAEARAAESDDGPNLRSLRELTDYEVRAAHGAVGDLHDLMLHPETWKVELLAVRAGGLLHRKHLLVATERIEAVDWAGNNVRARVGREGPIAPPGGGRRPDDQRPD